MSRMRSLLLIYLFSYGAFSYIQATTYVIVPGTWSLKSMWCLPGGDFYETLRKQLTTDDRLFCYTWSGKNNHQSRLIAAHNLASLLESCSQPLVLITHSHGTNVAILASQELARRGVTEKIEVVYALATPVEEEDYAPNMDVISYFYNLFSFDDVVQPVFGAFRREYTPHDRRANLRVTIDGKAPQHSSIHHPCVAQWIMNLHIHLNQQSTFDFLQPGIVHFSTKKLPEYQIDTEREQRKGLDTWFQMQLAYAFNRKRNEK